MTKRQHHPDELTPEQQQRMCPSCRIRWMYPPRALRDMYNPVALDKRTVAWLENAARVFDAESERRYTAEEFIAWVKPDLAGHNSRMTYEFDGSPNRNDATRHPDPLPYYTRKGAA